MKYRNHYDLNQSIKKNIGCAACAQRGIFYSGLKRNCPNCKKELIYSNSDTATRANKENTMCHSCTNKILGVGPTPQCIAASIVAHTGSKLSQEHIKKIILASTGLVRSPETRKRMSDALKGRIISYSSRRKMKISHNARFGREPDWEKPYTGGELRTWANQAKLKTPFCEWCFSENNLEAHHVIPKAIFPQYALDPNNARIMCNDCHVVCHKQGGY